MDDLNQLEESASDSTHAHIRDLILSGSLRPNQRLIEEDFAAQLGVSRTPVREALQRLKQEGLVVQRKGWVVRDHDPAEILEFIEARAGVESASARLAATRIDSETLAELEELLAQMEASIANRREFNVLNSRFHSLITRAGGNRVLASFARSTDINYWNFPTPIAFTASDDELITAQHRALHDALARGDADEAGRIAWAHVEHTAAVIARALGLSYRESAP